MAHETLSLATCNVEGDKHIPRVRDFILEYRPYIFCLQEAPQHLVSTLANQFGYCSVFQPTAEYKMASYPGLRSDLILGVAILSLGVPQNSGHLTYKGDSKNIPENQKGMPNSSNRELLFVRHGKFMFSTTHFTWSAGGQANDEQRSDLPHLVAQIDSLGAQVLSGDFNAPRPLEIYQVLAQKLTDNVPLDCASTLDPTLHRRPGLNLVVDYIFSTPNYLVSDVQAITGVSDHKALLAKVSCR